MSDRDDDQQSPSGNPRSSRRRWLLFGGLGGLGFATLAVALATRAWAHGRFGHGRGFHHARSASELGEQGRVREHLERHRGQRRAHANP
jgi:hypothetical protein